jgi:hypothetical protein
MISPAYPWSRSALRYLALLVVLLFAQHHAAMTAAAGSLEESSSIARGAVVATAAKSVHPGGVPGHHASSEAPASTPSAHCGMMEARTAPPITAGKVLIACGAPGSGAALLGLVSDRPIPGPAPVPILPHSIRQSLLQVFLF